MKRTWQVLVMLALGVSVVSSGCGDGGGSNFQPPPPPTNPTPTPASTPTPTPAPTPTPTPTPSPTPPPAPCPGCLAFDCTLYASPTGKEKNSGTTPTSPKTLSGASSASMPGSVICLMGGTYSFSKTFSPAHSGTANAWIVYQAYGDSDANLVWTGGTDYNFFGMEAPSFSSAYQYMEFRGLKLNGQNGVGSGFKCQWGHHMRFIGNYIKNMGSAGISSKYCDYLTADSNKVYHSGYNQGWSSGITFNSNQWLDTFGGFHNFVVNNIISGTYDGSTHHSDGNGIIMDLSNNRHDYGTANTPPALIANNVVYENGGRCIQPYVVTNIWVVNNTCYKNALDTQEAGIGEIVNSNSKNVHYINNLVYSWDNRNPYQQLQNGSNLVNYKELYYGGNNNFTYSDPNQFIKADPLFLNPPPVDPTAGGQYANALPPDQLGTKLTLKGTSPAIDKGIDPSTLPGLSTEIISGLRQYLFKDINGRSRPQGAAFDLGAYEH